MYVILNVSTVSSRIPNVAVMAKCWELGALHYIASGYNSNTLQQFFQLRLQSRLYTV